MVVVRYDLDDALHRNGAGEILQDIVQRGLGVIDVKLLLDGAPLLAALLALRRAVDAELVYGSLKLPDVRLDILGNEERHVLREAQVGLLGLREENLLPGLELGRLDLVGCAL